MADQVVIVGGGVLGAMHAVQARRRGLAVVHLEREQAERGASVRNFGLVWVSGRAPGAELALAQRARTLWAELAVLAPATGFRARGSLTVAADEAELGLLKEAAARPDVEERGFGLAPQAPVAAATAAQLLLVQRLDGSLTIGDTHSYDEPFEFDLDEAPYDHLRARAEQLLGVPLPPVRRRWAGVYSQVTGAGELYHRSQVAPGVVLVTGAGGRGMTCSPAIAEETFAPGT